MTNKQILEKMDSLGDFLDEEDCSDEVLNETINHMHKLTTEVISNCGRETFDSCENKYEKCRECENHDRYKRRKYE
jgi:hypothetical protein